VGRKRYVAGMSDFGSRSGSRLGQKPSLGKDLDPEPRPGTAESASGGV